MSENWTSENNPIDREADRCLEDPDNYNTVAMAGCWQEAYDAWDKELNVVYKQLMNSELDPKEKEQLRSTEKDWIKWRDSELKFIDNVYAHTEGSVHIPMAAYDKADLVKQRVLQLQDRLDTIGDGQEF